MLKHILTTTILLAGTASLHAQSNPLSAELKRFYEGSRNNLMRSAEKVPESGYSFKPTPDVRTFGQEIGHAAEYMVLICKGVKGEEKPNPAEGKTTKADLMAALKAAADYCDPIYDSLTDAQLGDKVKMLGRDISKQGALYFNVIHNNEDYGTIVPYMRLQGIIPPSSEPRGAGKKQ
jgi:hypothetical protein